MRELGRSRDRKILGVAGGFAEYFDMDKTIWRALWVFLCIAMPPAILAYFILGIVLPGPPAARYQAPQGPEPEVVVPPMGQGYAGQSYAGQDQAGQAYAGQAQAGQANAGQAQAGQAYAGQDQAGQAYAGQGQAGQPYSGRPLGNPAYNYSEQPRMERPVFTRDSYKQLTKSRDKWLSGVAGGVAEYFGVDPVIVRALWLGSVFLAGTGLLLYIVLAILMPEPHRQMPPR